MKRIFWLAMPLLLAAAPGQDGTPPFARATLNVQQGGTRGADGKVNGGSFAQVESFDVPADHQIHDQLIAFEGPGWESDKVAYRLYLDERNVPDIYGKRQPGAILPKIGMGHDDYHTLADWGMDVFQVDQSLGMGGIGVLRDGKVTQLGRSAIHAEARSIGTTAAVDVHNAGFPGAGGAADLKTRYAISPGSRVTMVTAAANGAVPRMVAGLTLHDGMTQVKGGTGRWRYFGTWGRQSLAKDDLGIVLFYRAGDAVQAGTNNGSLFVEFCDPARIRYAFAAAWVQEPDAPKTLDAFKAWADATAAGMDKQKEGAGTCKRPE
ncbi:DUF4861 family protein [Sphingomonas sp. dw_22]|uniref:DUF4861 family protein n=1 Tax=Sphingomonas sp. dw_22 TaxID=2721175 RepID=UPI001BD6CC29|nr:DUF4861 family protein [Sphingomonas sp. dw_22]